MDMLALLSALVVLITIGFIAYSVHYKTYLRPKKVKSGDFWDPVKVPEDGEDLCLCDLCHGRLGPDRIATCACGERFHPECIEMDSCPCCGNTPRHMRLRPPAVYLCPVCLRAAPDGYCEWCDIVSPHSDGTFRCTECGTVVFTSDPECRRCGSRYVPRVTKGYMSKVRSRR